MCFVFHFFNTFFFSIPIVELGNVEMKANDDNQEQVKRNEPNPKRARSQASIQENNFMSDDNDDDDNGRNESKPKSKRARLNTSNEAIPSEGEWISCDDGDDESIGKC